MSFSSQKAHGHSDSVGRKTQKPRKTLKVGDRYSGETLVYLTVMLQYINLLLITFCTAVGRKEVNLKYFILRFAHLRLWLRVALYQLCALRMNDDVGFWSLNRSLLLIGLD